MCELSDDLQIAALNQQLLHSSCEVSFGKTSALAGEARFMHPCRKGFNFRKDLNYHVETYESAYPDPNSQP